MNTTKNHTPIQRLRTIAHEQHESGDQATGQSLAFIADELEQQNQDLLAACEALVSCLSLQVRKSLPDYPEEQMAISDKMTVADVRKLITKTRTL